MQQYIRDIFNTTNKLDPYSAILGSQYGYLHVSKEKGNIHESQDSS
jgi:hypothetical protein